MQIDTCIKQSFCVIGKEGSTRDGDGFIAKLWADANSHYDEVAALAKKDEHGNPVGFWGAMSDNSRSFQPWADDFSNGLYLAGVEANDDAVAPENWVKWTIPGYEYLYLKVEDGVPAAFSAATQYMEQHGHSLAGAVHDYLCPEENGQLYMFFPIRKL